MTYLLVRSTALIWDIAAAIARGEPYTCLPSNAKQLQSTSKPVRISEIDL
jgi:hypothetical protein